MIKTSSRGKRLPPTSRELRTNEQVTCSREDGSAQGRPDPRPNDSDAIPVFAAAQPAVAVIDSAARIIGHRGQDNDFVAAVPEAKAGELESRACGAPISGG